MTTFIKLDKIIVQKSSVEGIGVFAAKDIREHELVERCPMVKLGWRSNYTHDPIIWKYCYTQPKCDCDDCKKHGFNFSYRDWETDRKSTRLNSSHLKLSRMPSSA